MTVVTPLPPGRPPPAGAGGEKRRRSTPGWGWGWGAGPALSRSRPGGRARRARPLLAKSLSAKPGSRLIPVEQSNPPSTSRETKGQTGRCGAPTPRAGPQHTQDRAQVLRGRTPGPQRQGPASGEVPRRRARPRKPEGQPTARARPAPRSAVMGAGGGRRSKLHSTPGGAPRLAPWWVACGWRPQLRPGGCGMKGGASLRLLGPRARTPLQVGWDGAGKRGEGEAPGASGEEGAGGGEAPSGLPPPPPSHGAAPGPRTSRPNAPRRT